MNIFLNNFMYEYPCSKTNNQNKFVKSAPTEHLGRRLPRALKRCDGGRQKLCLCSATIVWGWQMGISCVLGGCSSIRPRTEGVRWRSRIDHGSQVGRDGWMSRPAAEVGGKAVIEPVIGLTIAKSVPSLLPAEASKPRVLPQRWLPLQRSARSEHRARRWR